MNGYGSHTYQWINAAGERLLGQVPLQDRPGHQEPDRRRGRGPRRRGPRLPPARPARVDRARRLPVLDLHVQIMPSEDAQDLPLQPVRPDQGLAARGLPADRDRHAGAQPQPGELSSPRSSRSIFSPANFVPGIGPSPDKMLQGRLFAYADAHRYRVGINDDQLPVNQPKNQVNNYTQDGAQRHDFNAPAVPVYAPNSVGGPAAVEPQNPAGGWENDGAAHALRAHPARRGQRLRPGRHALPRGLRRRREGAPARDPHRRRQRRHEPRHQGTLLPVLDERRRRARRQAARQPRRGSVLRGRSSQQDRLSTMNWSY